MKDGLIFINILLIMICNQVGNFVIGYFIDTIYSLIDLYVIVYFYISHYQVNQIFLLIKEWFIMENL
jgi:hypothetical protein